MEQVLNSTDFQLFILNYWTDREYTITEARQKFDTDFFYFDYMVCIAPKGYVGLKTYRDIKGYGCPAINFAIDLITFLAHPYYTISGAQINLLASSIIIEADE